MVEAPVDRLLAAAREALMTVPHCWMATRSVDGGAHARVVRSWPGRDGEDEWTRRILIRRLSRKAEEIRRAPRLTLGYQHGSGDLYVSLVGTARIVEDRAEMRELWPASMDRLFPEGFADANMVVAVVDTSRIEIHARGLTAEPFGHGRTLIERETNGVWRCTIEN